MGTHEFTIIVDNFEESGNFIVSRQEYYSDYVSSMQNELEETILIAPDLMYVSEDNRLRLNYIANIQSEIDIAIELSNVVGIYLDEIAAGMDPIRLDVTMLEENGDTLATYHIKQKWGKQYQKDEIDVGDVSSKALETMDVK